MNCNLEQFLRSRKHDKGLKVHFQSFQPHHLVNFEQGPFIAFDPLSRTHPLKKESHLEDKKNVVS